MPWLLLAAASGGAFLYHEIAGIVSPSPVSVPSATDNTPSPYQLALYAAMAAGVYYIYRKARHA